MRLNFNEFKAKLFSSLTRDLSQPDAASWAFWPLLPIQGAWSQPPALEKGKINLGTNEPLKIRLVVKIHSACQDKNLLFAGKDHVDKMILILPYYVLWTFPLSFIARAKNLLAQCRNSGQHAQKGKNYATIKRLEMFLAQPKLRYERQGSDVTNQQPIGLFTYVAFNLKQQRLFSEIAKEYKCALNVHYCSMPFDDFFVQHAAEHEAEEYPRVGSLLNLISLENYANFEFTYSTMPIKKYFGGHMLHARFEAGGISPCSVERKVNFERTAVVATLDLSHLPVPGGLETQESHVLMFKRIDNLWESFFRPSEVVHVHDFNLLSCAYDLEVGRIAPTELDTFPTFRDGYVQTICAKASPFKGVLQYERACEYQFVYLPESIKTPDIDFVHAFAEARAGTASWTQRAELLVFFKEIDMLAFFLSSVLLNVDVLWGYNNFRFDGPMLAMRYNHLARAKEPLADAVVNLSRFYLTHDLVAMFNGNQVVKTTCPCPALSDDAGTPCMIKNVISKPQVESNAFTCIHCRKLVKFAPQTNGAGPKPTAAYDSLQFETAGHKYRSYDEFPFTLPLDYMTAAPEIFSECQDRRLETLCTFTFRDVIKEFEVPRANTLRLWLASVPGNIYTDFIFRYVPGMSLKLYHVLPVCKSPHFVAESNVSAVLFVDADGNCTRAAEGSDYLDFFDSLSSTKIVRVGVDMYAADADALLAEVKSMSDKTMYCAVGKTSSIDRHTQMNWACLSDAVETVRYCQTDANLTYMLEAKVRRIMDVLQASYLHVLPFTAHRLQSGQKTLRKEVLCLRKHVFLFQMVNSLQAPLYFDTALAVEGVRARIPSHVQVPNHPALLKLPAYRYANDLVQLDKGIMGVNEYNLGTMGSHSGDDLDRVQLSVDSLINNGPACSLF